jgi:hypothetical protein
MYVRKRSPESITIVQARNVDTREEGIMLLAKDEYLLEVQDE